MDQCTAPLPQLLHQDLPSLLVLPHFLLQLVDELQVKIPQKQLQNDSLPRIVPLNLPDLLFLKFLQTFCFSHTVGLASLIPLALLEPFRFFSHLSRLVEHSAIRNNSKKTQQTRRQQETRLPKTVNASRMDKLLTARSTLESLTFSTKKSHFFAHSRTFFFNSSLNSTVLYGVFRNKNFELSMDNKSVTIF